MGRNVIVYNVNDLCTTGKVQCDIAGHFAQCKQFLVCCILFTKAWYSVSEGVLQMPCIEMLEICIKLCGCSKSIAEAVH